MTQDQWYQLHPGDLIQITEMNDCFYGAVFEVVDRLHDKLVAIPKNELASKSQFTTLFAYSIYTKIGGGLNPAPPLKEETKLSKYNRLAYL